MPVISMFFGIIVSMYFMDNRRHKSPHIHARYQEHEAVISIQDGEVLEGSLPLGRFDWCWPGLKFIATNCWRIGNLRSADSTFSRSIH